MSITYYASGSVLNKLFGGVTFTEPANYYLGLSTTTISSSGSNATEPVGAAYARVAIVNDKTKFSYAASGSLVVSASVVFPESSGSWGTITDLFLSSASSGGNIWFYQNLPSPKVIASDTTVSFSASAIIISMTN